VDVVPVDRDASLAGVDDAANDADQRRLAGAVGAEQRKDFAAPDLQVNVLQRVEAGWRQTLAATIQEFPARARQRRYRRCFVICKRSTKTQFGLPPLPPLGPAPVP
jgi:hypothetical protein